MKYNSNEALGIGLPTRTSIEEMPFPIRFPGHFDGLLVEFSDIVRLSSTEYQADGSRQVYMCVSMCYKLVGRLLVAVLIQ